MVVRTYCELSLHSNTWQAGRREDVCVCAMNETIYYFKNILSCD